MAWHGRFLIMVIIGLASFLAQSVWAANNVDVSACQTVTNGIQIKRDYSNDWQILTNGCRDAGHGLRNYALQCASNTQYSVEWTGCETNNQAPAPIVVPVYSAPTVIISEPLNVDALETVASIPVANACSGHGWLHGDHCHCDAGYYAVDLECRALPTTSVNPVQTVSNQSAVVVVSPVQSNSAATATVVQCSGHGWLHEDHCHCDVGYYATGLQCLALPSAASSNSASTVVTVNNNSIANKNIAVTTQSGTKASVVTAKVVLECSGHGWLHGDHCHCDAGYYAAGVQCLALPGTVQIKVEQKQVTQTNQTAVNTAIAKQQPVEIVEQKSVNDQLQCSGHGHLHGDHCHCDAGYFAEGQSCVVLPVREVATYVATNGRSYKDEDFWVRPLSLSVYNFDNRTIVHWEGAQGDYDGFLVYVKPGVFTGALDAYSPFWLSRRQYSFAYRTEVSGTHTMYVFPYVTLKNGQVRRLEPGGVIQWSEPSRVEPPSYWQIFWQKLGFN